MVAREPGLILAIRAAGGVGALARKLGVRRQSIAWRRVPQQRLFDVAVVTGLNPVDLRPDLLDWILEERSRRRMGLARERFGLVRAATDAPPAPRYEDELAIDILIALAACRFVARERKMIPAHVMCGADKAGAAARSLAMALAHVAGRAKSPAIAVFFGVSRQNVDNASERYLRARDGDDPDDFESVGPDGLGRVIERGRVRRAKEAADDLWALETRFLAEITPPEAAPRARA